MGGKGKSADATDDLANQISTSNKEFTSFKGEITTALSAIQTTLSGLSTKDDMAQLRGELAGLLQSQEFEEAIEKVVETHTAPLVSRIDAMEKKLKESELRSCLKLITIDGIKPNKGSARETLLAGLPDRTSFGQIKFTARYIGKTEETKKILVEFQSSYDKELFVKGLKDNKTGSTLGISYADFIPDIMQEERRGLVTLGKELKKTGYVSNWNIINGGADIFLSCSYYSGVGSQKRKQWTSTKGPNIKASYCSIYPPLNTTSGNSANSSKPTFLKKRQPNAGAHSDGNLQHMETDTEINNDKRPLDHTPTKPADKGMAPPAKVLKPQSERSQSMKTTSST